MPVIDPKISADKNSHPKTRHQLHEIVNKTALFLENHPVPKIWVKLNQSVTIVAVSIAIFSFYVAFKKYNSDIARNDEDRIAKAWDVVARAGGRRANIGQKAALERLNALHQSLDHVDLHGTVILQLNLNGANLEDANFSGATLISSQLNDANLCNADFSGANLAGAELANAQFDDANFTKASLAFARVDVALFLAGSLENTDLTGVTLVFDDTEDGERWEAFSDTIAESRDDEDIQDLLDEACADPEYPIKVSRVLPYKFPTTPCATPLKYREIIARYKLSSTPTVANPFK